MFGVAPLIFAGEQIDLLEPTTFLWNSRLSSICRLSGENWAAEAAVDLALQAEEAVDLALEGQAAPDLALEAVLGTLALDAEQVVMEQIVGGRPIMDEALQAQAAVDLTLQAESAPDEALEAFPLVDETLEAEAAPDETLEAEETDLEAESELTNAESC